MNAPLLGVGVEPLVFPASLTELSEEYSTHAVRVRGVHESRRDAERPYLKRLFEWFGPPVSPADLFSRINADSVTRCLIEYASKYGPGSRRCMQNTVRLFLRFAYHAGYVERDLSALSPCARQPRMGRVMHPIPAECIETLQNSICGDAPADLRDRAIVCLLSTYGVRGVQVRRLRLEDVDWSRDRIHFSAAKRGRAVEQHLTASVGNRLADYLRKGRPSSPHREVFLRITEPFGPLAYSSALSEILRKRIEQAGITLPEGVAYGSHCFRHAFASRMYGRVPFKDVVDMLGHRDPCSTLIYGKVDLAALREAALPWPGGVQ
jgi:integrase/recombinase XerD